MIRYTKSPVSGDSIRPGRSGLISFSTSSSDSMLSSPSRRNSGLKPISNGSPWNGHRDRLAGLADVGGLRRDRQRALAEAEPQRRVLLRQQADPAHDVGELGAGEAQLVLDRLRQQLAVVRELAVDQARGEHDVAELEDRLVLPDADGDRVARAPAGRCARAPAERGPERWPRGSPAAAPRARSP